MKKEHILVIRFSALGDVAMVVPVVYSVAQQYPDVRITVLSRPFARTFFNNLLPNINFMSADVKKDYRGVKGLNTLYRRLVAKQPTAIADLHAVLRSNYLRLRFNLGRYHVEHLDKHRSARRKLVAREGKKILTPLPSPFENYSDVFARLGYPIEKITFQSIFSQHTDDSGKPVGDLSLLPQEIGSKQAGEQWVGIAPIAAHKGKTYPPELTEKVIRQLLQHNSRLRIFLFGRGPNEDELFSRWQREIPQCCYVSQLLNSMEQELILMSHLDVMMSMDSGNMHLASLTATPVVSVWGATHPAAGFMGYGQQLDNAIEIDLPCRPCSIYGQKACKRGDYQCLYGIKPETIVEKITSLLTKN